MKYLFIIDTYIKKNFCHYYKLTIDVKICSYDLNITNIANVFIWGRLFSEIVW